MTGLLLLIIGGLSTIGSSSALNATIAFMTILGLFGRTPMDEPRYDSLLTLLKHGRGESRGKVCLIFFDLSLPMCVYWYFRLPELKGRTVAEVQEMFQDGLPTIQDAVERY
ncbi:hypothetical protein N7450_003745 [Penicillium hetheringtonii]|uniref:Uncharacterized protein n=1 Tax=Penicillium hetheringtonii TaxID=911720 RepID=A0AAD6DNR9_9EURO|nr:hypothetical protein N7450_003745 [Penicillium hetheringtonii]